MKPATLYIDEHFHKKSLQPFSVLNGTKGILKILFPSHVGSLLCVQRSEVMHLIDLLLFCSARRWLTLHVIVVVFSQIQLNSNVIRFLDASAVS